LLDLLRRAQSRFHADRDAAARLLSVGHSTADPALDPAELAGWSTVASIVLNLDEAIVKD
jgi:hypothetical protein